MLEQGRHAGNGLVMEKCTSVGLMKKGVVFALVAACGILVCSALAGSGRKLDALLAVPVTRTKVFVEPADEPLLTVLKSTFPEEKDGLAEGVPVTGGTDDSAGDREASSVWLGKLRRQAG